MDGNYIRLALLSAIPVFLLFGIFFMIVVFGNLFQVFGPTKNIEPTLDTIQPSSPTSRLHITVAFSHLALRFRCEYTPSRYRLLLYQQSPA